jgi:hypothetical protein
MARTATPQNGFECVHVPCSLKGLAGERFLPAKRERVSERVSESECVCGWEAEENMSVELVLVM